MGKTTVVRQLGESFDNFVEINFEEQPDIATFFDGSLDPKDILHYLENHLSVQIEDQSTLLFFDEIQACPKAMLSLRYFFEKRPGLHVIAAGSLLDFEIERISFPVGRVDFYYLYPLSFGEYLEAIGKKGLRTDIRSSKLLPEGIHNQLNRLLRDYTIIGGMPQVVAEYIESGNLAECQNIQSSIIETFFADFPKYARKNQVKYLSTVFKAIPSQLGRKLKYTNISNLYKSRDLGDALEVLELAGLLTRVYHSSSNGIPLEHEKNFKRFKVILFDIGLVMRMLHIPFQDLLVNDDITLVNEGSIAEQLVGQEILAYSSCREKARLFYWHREAKSSNAEVDYVIEKNGDVIPVEVKSGLTGRTRSLQIYRNEKQPPYAICFSRNPSSDENALHYSPLYHVESWIR